MFVNWFEINVSDFEKSLNFYQKVFGVQITTHDFQNQKHGAFSLEDGPKGVIIENPRLSGKSATTLFFHVISVSEIIERTIEQGGSIEVPKTLMKSEVGGNLVISQTLMDGEIGYFAKIKDLDGNIIGIHSNA